MYQVILDNPDDDPTTYKEALDDVDMQEWKRAMDHEMESMGLNLIWFLVEAPKGVKLIGSKLIYKKKSPGKPCVDVDVQEWKRLNGPWDGIYGFKLNMVSCRSS